MRGQVGRERASLRGGKSCHDGNYNAEECTHDVLEPRQSKKWSLDHRKTPSYDVYLRSKDHLFMVSSLLTIYS